MRDALDATAVLGRCSALAQVTPETLELIAARCTRRTFGVGELLIEQGDPGDSLLVLIQGRASAATVDREGTRRDVGGFRAFDLVGEMALLTGEPRTADVTATQAGEALVLATADFRELTSSHPELGVVITNLVAERLGDGGADGLGGKTVGDYVIRRCIGRGAMAIVYEAEQRHTGATHALKMMSHRLIYEHGAMARFQREAEILAGLSHPNIVRYLDRFPAYKTWFLAMEFCDGPDLAAAIENGFLPDDREVRALLGQLAAGLAYLHDRGVVHRDLKPQNVLVAPDGLLRITDFGIARPSIARQPEGLTAPGMMLGTPRYMAPELLEGEDATPASDVYALGCIALHLLTGEPPFPARSLFDIAAQKRRAAMPRRRRLGRRSFWRGLSRPVYELIRRCIAPDPAARTVDLGAVAAWSAPVQFPRECLQRATPPAKD